MGSVFFPQEDIFRKMIRVRSIRLIFFIGFFCIIFFIISIIKFFEINIKITGELINGRSESYQKFLYYCTYRSR